MECPVNASLAETCLASCYCLNDTLPPPLLEPIDYNDNVAIAFWLVTASGSCTALGACLVFCNRCVTQSNHKVLGASLGFSSGVMLFVSFVEILQKSHQAFATCDCLWDMKSTEDAAYIASLLCFFLGVVLVYLLDFLVHAISKNLPQSIQDGHAHGSLPANESRHRNSTSNPAAPSNNEPQFRYPSDLSRHVQEDISRHSAFSRHNPMMDLLASPPPTTTTIEDDTRRNPLVEDNARFPRKHPSSSEPQPDFFALGNAEESTSEEEEESTHRRRVSPRFNPTKPELSILIEESTTPTLTPQDVESQSPQQETPELSSSAKEIADKKRLVHMGLMTAAAIGLHNFPEGLATFVAALADPKVGAGLAVAVAIHNIPEGLCVSIPIYYATGSRCKGFWIAFLSGVTELVGAALGYAFLSAAMGPAAYGILFGLVAGMMVTIVTKELLPTAHRYDEADSVVSTCIFSGMAIMALSLMLFKI